ncbi:MAG: F0F1 ATP synthase subunit epsilon [Armatimonadota bacterium]
MAARTFTVDIVTPDRVVLSEEATSLVAPGINGSFGILPNHAPFLSELEPGELRFRRDGGHEARLAIGGGFLQVFNNQVTVLADTAERAEEIDLERARRAIERARQEIREATASYDDEAREQAEQTLARAQNRIRVATG